MKRNVFNSTLLGLVLMGLTEVGASSLSTEYKNQIAAVKQSYNAILKMGSSSKEVQYTAVEKDVSASKYIVNQDKETQLAAIKKRYAAIIR